MEPSTDSSTDTALRSRLHAYLPAHFRNPLGLAWRLVRSGDAAAWFAMTSSLMGVAAAPVDWLLAAREQRLYRSAPPPRRPIVLVAGPPRSGTTVVAQTLIASLPVAYINNLTSIFPRSPITINRLYRHPFRNEGVEPKSYYGRTAHLWGPNDGLYLWDRWLGSNRTLVPTRIDPARADEMRGFFGAFEEAFGRPLLNKNNSLNVLAHLVADVLPTTRFLCVRREPLQLAESLLIARRHIHGDDRVRYGIDDPDRRGPINDPYEDVCDQVGFYEMQAKLQVERIGSARFQVVSYEDFCADPAALVAQVASAWLETEVDERALRERLVPLRVSRERKLPVDEHRRLRGGLEKRGIDCGPSREES